MLRREIHHSTPVMFETVAYKTTVLKDGTHRILGKWRRLPYYSVRIAISTRETFKVFLMCSIRRSKSSFPTAAFFF